MMILNVMRQPLISKGEMFNEGDLPGLDKGKNKQAAYGWEERLELTRTLRRDGKGLERVCSEIGKENMRRRTWGKTCQEQLR